MNRLSLKTKLLFILLSVGIIPAISISIYFYGKSSSALEQQAMLKLESIQALKSKALENYFNLIKNQVLSLAHSENTKKIFSDYQIGFKSYLNEHRYSSIDLIAQKQKLQNYYKDEFAKEFEKQNSKTIDISQLLNLSDTQISLQAAYIGFNQNPLGSKHLFDGPENKSSYDEVHAKYHKDFKEFLERFELYDIFLIDGDTGEIIYTVFKELDFTTSLKNGPYKDSGLARVYEKAMAMEDENNVVMEDYDVYRPSYDGPAGFIATPIKINGVKKGVLAFQISFDKINSFMANHGLIEKTLESFLVGADFKMRSDSSLDSANRNVKSSFRNPEKGSIKTETIEEALKGKIIKKIGKNYLEKETVIVASPVNILGHTWVMNTQWGKEEAFESIVSMRSAFIIFLIVTSGLVVAIAVWFAKKLSNALLIVTEGLKAEADTVEITSSDIAEASHKLSEASTQAASSLQETVASIDEISAMIARNADSSASVEKTSNNATETAQIGKEKVEQMLSSIEAISSGNAEIIRQIGNSNQEISEIIQVIDHISEKTKVINDIVFQTKLLSFNASVEAARAGEHGKGFAVVAEEIGSLATMSGQAAAEISEILISSVKKVTDIVQSTKTLMGHLVEESKTKIDHGTSTARECAGALEQILENVSQVNTRIIEISTASQEQSIGVKEVSKAINELDHVTESNSSVAQETSQSAENLKTQSQRLNSLVSELNLLIQGTNYSK